MKKDHYNLINLFGTAPGRRPSVRLSILRKSVA